MAAGGRKEVLGRPILYKTTKDFLLRFGLKDINELPSIEEFENLTSAAQSDLFIEGRAETNGADGPTSVNETRDEQQISTQPDEHLDTKAAS